MKALKSIIYFAAAMILLVVSSCSKTDNSYADYVSNENAIILKINAYDVLTNAGIKVGSEGITLSDDLLKLVPGYLHDSLNGMLKVQGVDPRNVILTFDQDSETGMYAILELTDRDQFVEYITTQLSFREGAKKGDLDYYNAVDVTLALSQDFAIFIANKEEMAIEAIAKIKKHATKSPLSKRQREALGKDLSSVALVNFEAIADYADRLTKSSTNTEIKENIPASLASGTLVLESMLKGLNLNVKAYMADTEGKVIEAKEWQAPDFDKKMLAYANAVDRVVFIGSYPENDQWKEVLGNMLAKTFDTASDTLAPLYENLQGTMMLSMGYRSLAELLDDNGYSLTLATQCTPGKLDDTYAQWSALLKSVEKGNPGVAVDDNGEVITVSVQNLDFYITKKDDALVFSSNKTIPTTGSQIIPASDFGKYSNQLIVKVPANQPDLTYLQLPFSLEFNCHSDGKVGEISLTMGDTEGMLLENVISFLLSLWM